MRLTRFAGNIVYPFPQVEIANPPFPLVFGFRLRSGGNAKVRAAEVLPEMNCGVYDMYRKNNVIAMGEKTGVEKKRKRRRRRDGRRCANEFNLKKSAGGSAPGARGRRQTSSEHRRQARTQRRKHLPNYWAISDVPLISSGFLRPISCKTVGAMSPRFPPFLSFSPSSPLPYITTSTGFMVWRV